MRLSNKIIIYYLIFSIPLFLLGGWLLSRGIERSLQHEVDEELLNSKALWGKYIDRLPANADLSGLQIPFLNIARDTAATADDHFFDTTMYQPVDKRVVPFRMLRTFKLKNGQPYRLTLQYTLVEKEDVAKYIIRLMALIMMAMLLVFLLINYFINKTVWRPFHTSLGKLTNLDIKQLGNISFGKTPTKEFTVLNETLDNMTRKIHGDYLSMKNFTENASHEIQTPLAIIQSKLEMLLQDGTLTQKQTASISAASQACQRLSKLNQALLLFTRIENNQFKAERQINAREVVEKYLSFFEELIEKKELVVDNQLKADCFLYVHPMLLDILVSNLFSNAIRYNRQRGSLRLNMHEAGFSIQNTSNLPAIDGNALFKRFARREHPGGNGLGLAIVKEICDSNHLNIKYTHEGNQHMFDIRK